VIDLNTPLGQQFLDIAVGQAVAQVPPDRDHDHRRREPEPGERRLLGKGNRTTATAFHRLSVPGHVSR
jgi:hypothetical protein